MAEALRVEVLEPNGSRRPYRAIITDADNPYLRLWRSGELSGASGSVYMDAKTPAGLKRQINKRLKARKKFLKKQARSEARAHRAEMRREARRERQERAFRTLEATFDKEITYD